MFWEVRPYLGMTSQPGRLQYALCDLILENMGIGSLHIGLLLWREEPRPRFLRASGIKKLINAARDTNMLDK